jgi:glycosyltransferase involved in cell wall biosynthesis
VSDDLTTNAEVQSRPLRFCMLTTFYPPHHFGGDAMGVQRLSRALVRRGHHVTVVHDVDAYNTLHHGPEPVPQPEPEGLEVIRLRSGVGALSPLLTQQTGNPIVNGRRIRRILDDGRFDVVNFHNVSLVGGPGLLSYGRDAVKLYMAHEHWLVCPMHVLWRHGRELCTGRECFRCAIAYRRPPQLWRYTGYLERQLDQVDAFIAMSEFSREKHREFGFPRPMEVLPYFLPDPVTGRPSPRIGGSTPAGDDDSPHPRPYFLFVGRLEKLKGLDDVIPLFRDFSDADLVIAGDGEYAPVLRQLAAGLPGVRFLGRVAPDDLQRYYRHAISLIVPSVCFETFGIILIESFKEATPVIARRLGPLPEIVEQAAGGELFSTGDELLAAMRRLQGDRAYRDRLARSAFQTFTERWSEQAVIPKYLDIVRRAAARRRARSTAPQAPSTSEVA